MALGFVYVLINPSMPGHVKVGKTTKSPEERAKELSAATGVPTPFVVAYDATFHDCDRAEEYVHAVLEARGLVRTPNREFFTASLRDVIAVVVEAERALRDTQRPDAANDAVGGPVISADAPLEPLEPWVYVLREAQEWDYGEGDRLEDPERAMALYKQAARMGAPDAYLRLGSLCADRGNPEEGLRWLVQGAENGIAECWRELALVYMGNNMFFEVPPHDANARKAWRNFFRALRPADCENFGITPLFFMLKGYVELVRHGERDERDTDVIRSFGCRFADSIAQLPSPSERSAKLRGLQELLKTLSIAV